MKKKRLSVTLSKPYIDFISNMIRTGLYFNNGAVMMEALRLLSKETGVPILNEEAKNQ